MLNKYIVKKALETVALVGCRDPFEAARQCGIRCCLKDIGSLKGAYFEMKTGAAIVINENLDENMQTIVCAHELGHHFLHSGKTQNCKSMSFHTENGIVEHEANIFAAAFLMDKGRVEELLKQGYTIYECASIMGFVVEFLKFFLNILNISVTIDSVFLK